MSTIATAVICLGTKVSEWVQDFVYLEQSIKEEHNLHASLSDRIWPLSIKADEPKG